jgi:hypothetical protein
VEFVLPSFSYESKFLALTFVKWVVVVCSCIGAAIPSGIKHMRKIRGSSHKMTIAPMPTITLADYRISAIAGEGQSASYNPSLY